MIMKNIQVVLALLLTLLTLWTPLVTGAATGDAVLDTTGESVETSWLYNIIPVIPRQGGGVTLSSPNRTCPLNVAQDVVDVSNGFPVILWQGDSGNGVVVTESMAIRIMFSSLSVCTESSIWKVGDADSVTGRMYVITGGTFNDEESLFSIEKYGGNYTLMFCDETQLNGPILVGSMSGRSGCGYIGVYNEGGERWLGLSDEPFLVRFKRIVGVGDKERRNEI